MILFVGHVIVMVIPDRPLCLKYRSRVNVRITASLQVRGPAYFLNAVQGIILLYEKLGRWGGVVSLANDEANIILEASQQMPHLNNSLNMLFSDPLGAAREFASFVTNNREVTTFNNMLTQLSASADQQLISVLLSTPERIAEFVAYFVNYLGVAITGNTEGDIFFIAR